MQIVPIRRDVTYTNVTLTLKKKKKLKQSLHLYNLKTLNTKIGSNPLRLWIHCKEFKQKGQNFDWSLNNKTTLMNTFKYEVHNFTPNLTHISLICYTKTELTQSEPEIENLNRRHWTELISTKAKSEPYLRRNSRCVFRTMLIDDVVISQDDNVALYLLRDALHPSRRRDRQP